MKKTLFFILVCSLISISGFSQITKKLDFFNKVSSFDKITIFLIPSTENKVEVSGFNADKVDLILENNELKIKLPKELGIQGNDILAKVYFVNLQGVEAAGGSNIGASQAIQTANFEIICTENSMVKLEVKARKITARLSQGSTLDLLGNTDNLDVTASNNSKVNTKKCQVQEAIVNANAGAEVSVNASQLVDAKVRAGGTITIYGKPKQVLQKTILGGEIVLN